MNHHKIKIEKTAHYYTHGQITPKVKYFWIAAHGYGQLASNLMRKFQHLVPILNQLIANFANPKNLNF